MRTLRVTALATSVLLATSAITALAVSFTDRQANQPQVAGDARSNTTARFPTNKQNEPTVAVNPINPLRLIGGANDEQRQPPCGPGPVRGTVPANDCSFFRDVGTDGVYTSSDGGLTWTNRGLLPGFSDNGGSLVSDGDPVIVYGPRPDASGNFSFTNGARAYYASLASFATGQNRGQQNPELLTVSLSDDDGVTWSNPIVAVSSNGFIFNDKENIWADTSPSSPFFGRVYVSWTQFRDPIAFASEPIEVAFSADGGRTWSRPNQISIAQNFAFGGRQFSALRTGPDGTVYAVWLDSDVNGIKQVVAISRDGGVSWTHSSTVARLQRFMADPIPGANFRTGPYPNVATSASGTVYVAYVDEIAGVGRVVVTKSTNGGATWSTPLAVSPAADGYAFFQGLDVAPNGRVDVAYQALKTSNPSTYGTGNATVDAFYVSSSDGGATWTASTRISSKSSDPAASAQNNLRRQFWGDYNTLVSQNDAAWFIYTDSRDGAGCAAVDAFQHGVDGSGPATAKPAPQNDCPKQFGNTNLFVSRITP